jgi:hypothetical protein
MGPRPKTLVALAIVSACWVFTTWFVWAVLLAPREPDVPTVPFGDFLADVEHGLVTEVHVKDRLYVYVERDDDRSVRRQATGPEPTIAQVRALRPKDAAGRAPKVYFER